MLTREERVREIQKFTLLSDVFMSVALEDIPACEHVLRIFTGKKELTLRRVKTQYSISKIATKSVRLDVLAEDICGALYAIEVQRKASVDHARRVRFYSAMTDSSLLGKGEDYSGMPDRYIFYVSETDIWKGEEGGVERMCELTDMIEKRGENRGKRAVAINLAGMGMTVDRIAQAVEENVSVVQQWLSAESLSENR